MKELENLQHELNANKKVAYTADSFHGDITIKALLESLAEGVLIINEKGRIVLINSKLTELTGYEKADAIGMPMDILIPKRFHQKHKQHIANYFKAPRTRPMGIGMDLEAQRKDGSTFPIEISLSFMNTESGRMGVAFITDISKRKQVENELRQRNQELDSYAHSVAHDINSSVVGMIGLSEMLLNPKAILTDDQRKRFLSEIIKSGKKLNTIVKELLLFASMKKEDVELTQLNMLTLLNSAKDRLKYKIRESGADIRIDGEILSAQGYAQWIEEVWYNLLSNAVKYGGSPPQIKIYCEQATNGIAYYVCDNGQGISDELLEVLFEEQNVERDKHVLGSGLGLNIVKKILDKLDGEIRVSTQRGVGSCFVFSLPA